MNPRTLLSIVVCALAARFGNQLWIALGDLPLLVEDASYYWDLGRWIPESGWAYLNRGQPGAPFPEVERMPLYPYFLAIVTTLFGPHLQAVLAVQAALDAAACVMIGLLAARWSAGAGLIAGLLAAFSPILVIHSGMILTETLFLTLFTGMLLLALRFLERPTAGAAGGAGLLLGAATLARSVTAPMIGAMTVAAFAVAQARERRWLKSAGCAALLFAAACVAISPLLTRNFTELGAASLSAQSGPHLLLWVVPLVKQAETGRPFSEISAEMNDKIRARLDARGVSSESTNLLKRNAEFRALALEELRTVSPVAFVKAWGAAAALNLFAPSALLHPGVRSLRAEAFYDIEADGAIQRAIAWTVRSGPAFSAVVVVGGTATAIANLLALVGLVMLARRHPWTALFAGLCVLYFMLANGPVLSPKYRLPMEPVLLALMALPIDAWIRRRREP
ncbi:MAG: glycosyltransferase family 39 protein [Marivibrio sp.]|uniref:ArnT family glycosyltransferase n=1 Tax=Marivibrio sp. TaxID=2039719 RepID=UPI0032ED41C9